LSVFDNNDPIESLDVNYGGRFTMPIMRAHGGLVATAPSMLHLGNTYILGGNAIGSENPTALDEHSGALRAVQTITEQRSDGTVLYIFLNSRWFDNGTSTVEIPLDQLQAAINELLDDGPGEEWSWPETTSDGTWIVPTSSLFDFGLGGFDDPFRHFGNALNRAPSNSRLRIKPGSNAWTGTISKRLRIDAPLGTVQIGKP